MSVDWTDVRYVALYPALLIGGVSWAILLAMRFRSCAVVEAGWGAALGMAAAITGALGILSLVIANARGFSPVTSFLFTLGLAAPAVVVLAGALHLFWLQWRHGGGK